MKDTTSILVPESIYHVYNRANGSEKVFLSDDNYTYFLNKYEAYIRPIADTYCYCLMPNHFHFLIKIKPERELREYFAQAQNTSQGFKTLERYAGAQTAQGLKTLEQFAPLAPAHTPPLPKLLSQQFSNLFNGYTQAFNKQHRRMGSLLMHPYKRKRVDDFQYLINLVIYIHRNPLESNLRKHLHQWPYSSYGDIISNQTSMVNGSEVLTWFAGLENFIQTHQNKSGINTFFQRQYNVPNMASIEQGKD